MFKILFLLSAAVMRSIFILTLLATLFSQAIAQDLPLSTISFHRDILPILASNCFPCHGFDIKSRQAGLRLDTPEGAGALLDTGVRAIVPGSLESSELIRRITISDDSLSMPPSDSGKSLSDAQRKMLADWIASGARYEKHWAFIAPAEHVVPVVPHLDHPIDRFIGDAQAKTSLSISNQASPQTLLRRVSLDLIGLPPTISEIDAFIIATQSDPKRAYEQLVDRLLASEHYGERWGRWWLDMARYADSNGYSIDAPREIWQYRDWVVSAINRDLPFDQFTIEQIAGDLLPNATQEQKIATGFHRNTQINEEGGIDKEQFRMESVFDRVATTGSVWLGLSIGCAQCHDHKFDPITQHEYYRFFAFLNNQIEPKLQVVDSGVDLAQVTADWKSSEKDVLEFVLSRSTQLAHWETTLNDDARKLFSQEALAAITIAADKRTPEHKRVLFMVGLGSGDQTFRALNERYLEFRERVKNGPTTLVLEEMAVPRITTVLIGGSFTRPSEPVTPGTPSVLHPLEHSPEHQGKFPNRLDLAQWIMSDLNPLTARVIVNRVWQQYFGRGLVETDNDFGLMGSLPTHPELLDWLAISFQRHDWSLKSLHRLIVTSKTYQQSSVETLGHLSKDPHNYFLTRQKRLRLDAEIVRDVALTASGQLVATLGGPPVFPPVPQGAMRQGQVERIWTASQGPDRYRRGLYTFVYRASPPPSLNVFDAPDGFSTCTRRNRSNTPLQALTLLNDTTFVEFAYALEKIINRDGLEIAFRRCTSRDASQSELDILRSLDALSAARVLLNLDESVTRE